MTDDFPFGFVWSAVEGRPVYNLPEYWRRRAVEAERERDEARLEWPASVRHFRHRAEAAERSAELLEEALRRLISDVDEAATEGHVSAALARARAALAETRTGNPTLLRLRVGRKVGRTLYHQLGTEPSDADPLVGVMDTPELAAEVVAGIARRA